MQTRINSNHIESFFQGKTVSEPNADGTFKLTTTLQMKFNRGDDGRTFRCIVQPQPGRGERVTQDRRIFVRCKWSCCARNTPEERKFIVPLLVFCLCHQRCWKEFGLREPLVMGINIVVTYQKACAFP